MTSHRSCRFRLDSGQIEAVDDNVAALLRAKTHAERLAMVSDCDRAARTLIAAILRQRHPDWTQRRIIAAVAGRMSGEPT